MDWATLEFILVEDVGSEVDEKLNHVVLILVTNEFNLVSVNQIFILLDKPFERDFLFAIFHSQEELLKLFNSLSIL